MTGTGRFSEVRAIIESLEGLGDAERDRVLNQRCKGDPGLRAEVDAVLEAMRTDDGFLEPPMPDAASRALADIAAPNALPDQAFPGFRVLGVLGEGGMGVIYEAEQDRPRRRVALKVMRSALPTEELRRRFVLESEVLGRLQHPGIAQIYEAGTYGEAGRERPFFAMEFIEGRPLTAFANAEGLGTEARVTLLIRICEALEHAHQKGVIHRDLKPANILIGADGLPKVLDFGVARTSDAESPITQVNTSDGQIVGTLAYMSPEQLSGDPGAVDTRSDVYALGVLAYELLADRRPHDLTGLSFPDAVRSVDREVPTSLGSHKREMRGDLSTIVEKAMDKDKERRYQSSSLLAADLQRFLRSEPITARPPTTVYRVRKFTSRNPVLVGGLAAVFVVLVAGMIATSAAAAWALGAEAEARDNAEAAEQSAQAAAGSAAEAERETATAEAVSGFLTEMLRSIDPDLAQGGDVRVADVIEDARLRLDRGELAGQPGVEAQLRTVIGEIYSALGRYNEAIGQLEEALAIVSRVHGPRSARAAHTLERLAVTETAGGEYEDAEAHFELAAEVRRSTGSTDRALNEASLGGVYYWTGRYDEAERYFRRVLEETPEDSDDQRLLIANTLASLGATLERLGRIEDAIESHERSVSVLTRTVGEQHTDTAGALNSLANALEAAGDLDAARDAHERSLGIKRALLRDNHPAIATSLNNLAIVLARQGDHAGAETMLREAIRIRLGTLGEEHPSTATSHGNLARVLLLQNRLDAALGAYEEAIRLATDSMGEDDQMTIYFRANRGVCLGRMGRYEEAETILLAERARLESTLGSEHRRTASVSASLAALYEAWALPSGKARSPTRGAPGRSGGSGIDP